MESFKDDFKIVRPKSGNIVLNDKNINIFPAKERAKIIGYLPQIHNAPPDIDVFVGALEAYPKADVMTKLLNKINAKDIALAPLLLTASNHAKADMAGEQEESWKSQFEKAGFNVEPILKGMLELPSIRKIYIEHLEAVM